MEEYHYRPIGIIHSPFKNRQGTPIQPIGAIDKQATVEIFPEYIDGLQDLDGFSHIILLYHFHRSKDYRLKVRPFLDNMERGVFATRAPARPNPIGLSVVRLVQVNGAALIIQDIDIIDRTPLLDIKPYVPDFDNRKAASVGWLAKKVATADTMTDDGRFGG